MDRRKFKVMTKILEEVQSIKSDIKELKQNNCINSQTVDRIITRLELIDYVGSEELNNTLISIEDNFDETLYRGKGKPKLRLIKNDS